MKAFLSLTASKLSSRTLKAVLTNEAIMCVYVLPIFGFTIRLLASENNHLSQTAVKGLSGFGEEFCFISVYNTRRKGLKGEIFLYEG
jgi:hypothetical protein